MLLKTKLFPPSLHEDAIRRPRLHRFLDAGLMGRLTLVSAPAGFGKTTLILSWLQQKERPFAWVSLAESDNDPVQFWNYIITAIQSVSESLDETAAEMLQQAPIVPLENVVIALVNDIVEQQSDTDLSTPLLLVLDDYHLIEEGAIHKSLNFFLDHLPPAIHLVITTRIDPPLELGKRRGKRQLSELRAKELRFSSEEVETLLNGIHELEISQTDLAKLEERTDGWITGLQLVALSLQEHAQRSTFIQDFTGNDQYVMDYLMEEVIDKQPEDVRTFLSYTSVLNQFCPELCQVILDDLIDDVRIEASALLQSIEGGNLLLQLLDTRRQWYRYHPLFAEVLRQRLSQKAPNVVSRIHYQASIWFEKNGFVQEAITHAMTGTHNDRAVELISREAEPLLNAGRFTLLRRWLASIPKDVLLAHSNLTLMYARVLAFSGHAPHEYASLLEHVERHAGRSEYDRNRGEIALIRMVTAIDHGRADEAIRYGKQALTLLPETEIRVHGWTLMSLGTAYLQIGNLVEAAPLLRAAFKEHEHVGNRFLALSTSIWIGHLYFYQGLLQQAEKIVKQIKRSESKELLRRLVGLHVLESRLFYERNQLEEAEQALERAQEGVQQTDHQFWNLTILIDRARLAWLRGDRDAAQAHQEEAGLQARRLQNAKASLRAKVQKADWQLQTENISVAAQTAEMEILRVGNLITFETEPLYSLLVRIHIARGHFDEALYYLDRLIEVAEDDGRLYHVMQRSALKAAIQHLQGDSTSLVTLSDVLEQAEPQSYMRTFVGAGEPMVDLLRTAVLKTDNPSTYLRKLLIACEQQTSSSQSTAASTHRPSTPDILSERELDVLKLLAENLPNQAIAEQLFVSMNTVKTHTKNIYSKLYVHNRQEAVKQAKKLGLI